MTDQATSFYDNGIYTPSFFFFFTTTDWICYIIKQYKIHIVESQKQIYLWKILLRVSKQLGSALGVLEKFMCL